MARIKTEGPLQLGDSRGTSSIGTDNELLPDVTDPTSAELPNKLRRLVCGKDRDRRASSIGGFKRNFFNQS